MTESSILLRLRGADEGDVTRALDEAYVAAPLSEPTELLEFFNRMLDVVLGDDHN